MVKGQAEAAAEGSSSEAEMQKKAQSSVYRIEDRTSRESERERKIAVLPFSSIEMRRKERGMKRKR